MGKKEKINLLYKITDAEMYEDSKTKRGFFLEDKPDFIAFDADFADPFAADWLTKISDAEAMDSDEILNDQSTQLTVAVEAEMGKCRDKFQDSKYFIEKTFPDNGAVWNEFGYDNYDDSRRIQLKMIQFMKSFHKTATKYKTQLIAKGYLQPMIDEIETRRAALDDANQAQETFLGNMGVKTQDRYIKNNDVWEIMVQVCTAGKRIFKTDFAKYQRYLLPPGEENPAALSITGIVTDRANSAPLEGANIDVQPAVVHTLTAANGRYSFGALADGDYVVTVTLANYVTNTVNVTLTGGNAVELNVSLDHM